MAAGALLAGGPLLAFDYWISRIVERQSIDDVATWGTRVLALSDARISQILAEQGIVVARRTIAKYRESLQIPPVNQRKSL